MAYQTPGVYVEEKAFPNSVVAVATAVPAFIGYTETADRAGRSLRNVPCQISSFAEFRACFGGPPTATFNVSSAPGKSSAVEPAQKRERQFLLYRSMLLFFANGGGSCYVVSVGSTTDGTIAEGDLIAGIDTLLSEREPTMVVIPDAMHLPDAPSCIRVQQAALAHCARLRNRIAILDIYDGYKDRKDPAGDCVAQFRNQLGAGPLDFGVAYYPWLNTIVGEGTNQDYKSLDYRNVVAGDLTALLTAEGKVPPNIVAEVTVLKNYTAPRLNSTLLSLSAAFVQVMASIAHQMNLLPPAAAMAGLYTMVDGDSGVWRAPANISPVSVTSPAVLISQDEQQDLNTDIQGKSINAFRTFAGQGVLVWGAKTLDGNSSDWRYVNVRRTVIMLEQSIKLAIETYIFEDNAVAVWETIKSMIRSFLTGFWESGGLAGATPGDAFGVSCGLGETMTAEDIMQGILRVTVSVAVTHPAEFIVIAFQQQMRKS